MICTQNASRLATGLWPERRRAQPCPLCHGSAAPWPDADVAQHRTVRRIRQPTFHPSIADEHPEEMIPGEILSATRMSFFIIFPPLPSALPIRGSQAATSRRPVPSPAERLRFPRNRHRRQSGRVKIFTCRRPQMRPMAQNIQPWDQRLRPPIFRPPVSDFDLSFTLTELKSQGVVGTAKKQEGMVSVW